MFYNFTKVENIEFRLIDTSNVTSMSMMFDICSNLKKLDLSIFDTSKVIAMNKMFGYNTNLTLIEVSDSWIIGENTDTTNMFNSCGTNTVTLKQ